MLQDLISNMLFLTVADGFSVDGLMNSLSSGFSFNVFLDKFAFIIKN